MDNEKPHILVIDDELTIRNTIVRILRNEPCEVVTASNGIEGLEKLHNRHPDLILLDLVMPELSGIDFLKTIKLKPDDPYAVIILTGLGDDNEVRQCYELGAHFFLKKPFSITEFICLIKRCLTLKKLEREAHFYQQYLEESVKEQTDYVTKLSMALDQCGSAVLMTDENGNITYANKAFLETTGFSLADAQGQKPYFMNADKNPSTAQGILDDLSSNGSWKWEVINAKKDGKKYWAHTTISPVRAASGDVLNFLVIADDITAIKEAQKAKDNAQTEVAESKKMQADFSNNISHELLTPLHIISSSASLLETKGLSDDQKKYVTFIKDSASDLNYLIDTLLQLKIAQGDKIQVRQHPFSIKEIFEDLTALHKKNIEKKTIDIFFNIDKTLPSIIVGDEIRIRQILSYLLNNALKFTQKGHVSLSASLLKTRHDYLLDIAFEIADTGIGISRNKVEQIFDPFLQGDGTSSREFSGLGIGLTLVKSLVNSLNGEIHVDSVKDKGSIFTVTLPLAPSDT